MLMWLNKYYFKGSGIQMPTSHHETISKVIDLVIQFDPRSILDIGVGYGKMGMLCREYLDIWHRRYTKQDWQVKIDGIEIYEQYRNPIHEACYNTIKYDNVMNHLDIISGYDLVLIIDVIEHLTKDDADELLSSITGAYIITTPKTFHSDVAGVGGNKYEQHISRWFPSEFPNQIIMQDQILAWSTNKRDNTMGDWQIAQQSEREWWEDCRNTYFEEEKQLKYAEKMGLRRIPGPKTPYRFDMGGRSVLDIGGGPTSLLLKCDNVRGIIVDPLEYPQWVYERYKLAGIEYKRGKGEDIDATGFDEVWLYNVLQHVEDPQRVIQNARKAGKVVRIFEWVDAQTNQCHIHKLDAASLDLWLGSKGNLEPVNDRESIKMYFGKFQGISETIIHFILTSEELIYPYYLAILSALNTQKADKIFLWAFGIPQGEYWKILQHDVELQIIDAPDIVGMPDKTGAPYREQINDYLEWKILYEHGGIYLDLDTFCLEDITHFLKTSKKELVLAHEVEDDAPSYPFFNATIVMAKQHSQLMLQVLNQSEALRESAEIDRGAMSCQLTIVARKNLEKIETIEYGVLGGGGTDRPAKRLAEAGTELLVQTKVIHVFGNDAPYFRSMSEEFIRDSSILFAKTVRNSLTPAEWGPHILDASMGESDVGSGAGASEVSEQSQWIPNPVPEPVIPLRDPTIGSHILNHERSIRPKRFHLLGLPHVAANEKELCCAFSQKVRKMGKMLMSMGHTVLFYGVEGSDVECNEFIPVSTQAIIDESYGVYDTSKETYRHDVNSNATKVFNHNCIKEIRARMQSNDFLLIPFSPVVYKTLIDELKTIDIYQEDKLKLIVEMGVGYRGIYCPYRVFESVSQMHYNYGLSGIQGQMNELWYDCVIPNYFDPTDFTYSEKKEDYFLYLGRVIFRKGVSVAVQTARKIGAKLIVAGQKDGAPVDLSEAFVEDVGFAGLDARRKLLSGAKALFLPTQYVEPFGGTIIEAALSGTPVITSDWGAFPELVIHGKTGYRCRTLDQFVWAANNIDAIKPLDCYEYAMANFTLDRVKWMYEEYWDMLLDVKENINGKGWSRIHPERKDLDWLVKSY